MPPSSSITEFRSDLQESRNVIAIAGAGLSSASGIPTFRGAGGLWRSYDALTLATPRAFAANPSRVWQFHHMRRETVLKVSPNPAHLALAVLALPEKRKAVAPNARSFTLITQNVDGLSAAALCQASQAAGIPTPTASLLEMHGRLLETICTKCNDRRPNTDSPICPALQGTEDKLNKEDEVDIPLRDLPQCTRCSGLLRPGVVWFEEVPHHLNEIGKLVDEADLAIVVGTSSTVYPAAGYAQDVMDHGGKVAVFNLDHTEGDEDADFLFLGPCEETLPNILLSTTT